MKKIVLLLVLFTSTFSLAQENYKYAIVPKKFSFFSEENEYNTSSMTKAFFEKEGFVVYYDTDEFPSELANNRCMAFYVNVLKKSNMFITKINFELKDCANKIIYTSIQGSSKEKEYQKSYNESFRIALGAMKGQLNFANTSKTIVSEVNEKTVVTPVAIDSNNNETKQKLTAVPMQNGYKLVDSVPAVIYELLATSIENVYTAKKGTITGTFLKKNTGWYFEYYQNDQLVSEKVEVKF
ncbi:hypothetical protein [Flavobacterium sp.]|jgi:hypothetical protein|uniref:hypothetical protein n=1 Tax=Flavobacterium sp. TaxID=239 RepID=UPI0037C06189